MSLFSILHSLTQVACIRVSKLIVESRCPSVNFHVYCGIIFISIFTNFVWIILYQYFFSTFYSLHIILHKFAHNVPSSYFFPAKKKPEVLEIPSPIFYYSSSSLPSTPLLSSYNHPEHSPLFFPSNQQ